MIFIFEIQLKEGCSEQDYVGAWRKGSGRIQKSDGARGTILYRKIGEPRTLIAIATWDSKEARDAGMEVLKQADADIQEILMKHKEFGEPKILGEFEEIARVGLGEE